MTTTHLTSSERERVARAALAALGSRRGEAVVLHVNCPCSHHLASVVHTAEGPVYVAVLHGRSHGHRDFVDTPHHAHDEMHVVDLLGAPGEVDTAEDMLPAWCDCGQRELSRAALQRWLADGERRVVVD